MQVDRGVVAAMHMLCGLDSLESFESCNSSIYNVVVTVVSAQKPLDPQHANSELVVIKPVQRGHSVIDKNNHLPIMTIMNYIKGALCLHFQRVIDAGHPSVC